MANKHKPTDKDKTAHKPNHENQKDSQPLGEPDPETLHTTDPQEHMKGPISSMMQKVKEEAESNDEEDREEVRREPDEKKR